MKTLKLNKRQADALLVALGAAETDMEAYTQAWEPTRHYGTKKFMRKPDPVYFKAKRRLAAHKKLTAAIKEQLADTTPAKKNDRAPA